MLRELIKVAYQLDRSGFLDEANSIDQMIRVLASEGCKYKKEYLKIIDVFTKAFKDSKIIVEESSFCAGDKINIIFNMSHELDLGEPDPISCLQKVEINVNGPSEGKDTISYSVSASLKAYGTKYGDSFLVKKDHTETEKEYRFQRGQVAYTMRDIVFQMIDEQTDDLNTFILEQETIVNDL
jgi:hypothetical protein